MERIDFSKSFQMCEYCEKRSAIKTGGDGKWACHHCAAGLPDPYIKPPTQGRNEKCACKSGKKFKYCCLRKQDEKGDSEVGSSDG